MRILVKIISIIFVTFFLLTIYYLYPIQNKNNIADPALYSRLTEKGHFYHIWRKQFDLLQRGSCPQVLWQYLQRPNNHQNQYWLSRMLTHGVCLPKDPEAAFVLAHRHTQRLLYYKDIFRLGYFVEIGIGREANPVLALRFYKAAFRLMDDLDEQAYQRFTHENHYLFDGKKGTALLHLAFDEFIMTNTPKPSP